MEVYVLAADLKILPDNSVKLLEIMPIDVASVKGYKNITGADMLDDHIIPSLKNTSRHAIYLRRQTGKKIADFQISSLKKDTLVLFELGSLLDHTFVQLIEKLGACVVNANANIATLLANKAALHFALSKENRTTFPETHILSTNLNDSPSSDEEESIRHNIARKSDLLLIKPAQTSNGIGIRLIPANKWLKKLKKIIQPSNKTESRWRIDFWRSIKSPIVIIQPFLEGKKIDKEGKKYDPTMRVCFIMHRENPNEPFKINIHDGFWKLPYKPVQKKPNRESRISFSFGWNEAQISQQIVMILFNKAVREGTHFAVVSDNDKNLAFEFLNNHMPKIMANIADIDMHKKTKEWLYSDDPILQGVALITAMNRYYTPYNFDTPGAAEEQFLETLRTIAFDRTNTHYDYIWHLAFNQTVRTHTNCAVPDNFFKDIIKKKTTARLMQIIDRIQVSIG